MADPEKLRAWWSHKQGLDGFLIGVAAADVLVRTGWARSVGGANPYLSLFARSGVARVQADKAVADVAIYELPSARGCTYVVPAAHYALALTVGKSTDAGQDQSNSMKLLGITRDEIDALCARVLSALVKGPLDPRQLKQASEGAVRNLGEEGKKRGMTTTLPLALGRLQQSGDIRRVPTNGRLDQQRYAYAAWSPSPLVDFRLTAEEAAVELARLYFRWIGPASLKHFRWFSGLGAGAAKEAVTPLGLVPLEPEAELLVFPDDLEAFHSFTAPTEPIYRLVGSIDGITHLRRDVASLLDERDSARQMMSEKGLVGIGGVQDLSSHAIVDRGRLVGLWEYEPASDSIAWCSFVSVSDALKREVLRTESYVRDELGDARSFSLDSPESRRPWIAALRGAAAEVA